jgi:hypothetical protein
MDGGHRSGSDGLGNLAVWLFAAALPGSGLFLMIFIWIILTGGGGL